MLLAIGSVLGASPAPTSTAAGRSAVPGARRQPGGLRLRRGAASGDHRPGRTDHRRDRGADRGRGRRLHAGDGSGRPHDRRGRIGRRRVDGRVGRRAGWRQRRPGDPVRARHEPQARPGPAVRGRRVRFDLPLDRRAAGDLRRRDGAAAPERRHRQRRPRGPRPRPPDDVRGRGGRLARAGRARTVARAAVPGSRRRPGRLRLRRHPEPGCDRPGRDRHRRHRGADRCRGRRSTRSGPATTTSPRPRPNREPARSSTSGASGAPASTTGW